MFNFRAAWRATFSSAAEAQLPNTSFPSQHFIKAPDTPKPACFSRAAATEESTPPDMATITFLFDFFLMKPAMVYFYNSFLSFFQCKSRGGEKFSPALFY